MRYEADKAIPVKPRYHKGQYGRKYDTWSCGNCGAGVPEAHWKYCPNCGQAIKKAEYAGTQGWTHETAEQVFRKMMEGTLDD
jgi:predicted RNA-binding Zn-ribbon protein involved in translation (DUF1610 family)